MKSVILLGVVLSTGFTSCQLVNKYETPEIDTSNLFRDKTSSDTTTIASLSWREYFQDPLLQALIHEGLEHNYDMRTAAERIKQAEVQLMMAKADYFPNLALAGNVNQTRISNGARGKDVLGYRAEQSFQLGVAASWELDVWGKINRQHRSAKAQYWSSLEAKNLIQTSIVSNVATMYYSLMALDEQLKVTQEMITILQESTKTIKAKMDAGEPGFNGAGVEQSKGVLYSTQTTIPDLESAIRELEHSLCLVLGRKPSSITRNKLEIQAVPTEMSFGVPAQMLANRPDVKMAEFNFRSAFELTNAARASFYPSISLSSGFLGLGSNTLSDFFKPENLLLNFVGNLTQPIFAKGQLVGNLKISKANQEIALIEFERSVVSAGSEVSEILYSFNKSLSKNTTRDNQVKSLTLAVDYSHKLLVANEVTYTEVLNAEQGLLQAQLNQVSDKLEQLQYSVNLYRALGGGTK